MTGIAASVGIGGVNAADDVRQVQILLNLRLPKLGLPSLGEDGKIGDATLVAIMAFQEEVMGLDTPDGRIDPDGKTWRALAGTPNSSPAPAADPSLSGASWWHANQARYPNSDKVADLADPFRTKATKFLTALRAAGARVTISATRRNETRAKLMNYCWRVAHGSLAPNAVPAIAGCAIHWDHGNLDASKRGAQDMVDLFGIVFEPALTSLHIDGRAVDLNIGWDGILHVRDAGGAAHAVGAPQDGATNDDLHRVGATYGVLKLLSDAPHWSDNGH